MFSLRDGEFGEWRSLSVVGEIDLASLPAFQQRVRALTRESRDLFVDLDGCEFIDSAGLGVLVGAARRCRDAGQRFAVVASVDRTRHSLERTRLDQIIRVVREVSELDDLPVGGGAG